MTGSALRMTGSALRMTGSALRMTGGALRMKGRGIRDKSTSLRFCNNFYRRHTVGDDIDAVAEIARADLQSVRFAAVGDALIYQFTGDVTPRRHKKSV